MGLTCNTRVCKMLVGQLKRQCYFVMLGVEGRIILEWILKEKSGRLRSLFIWFSTGTTGDLM